MSTMAPRATIEQVAPKAPPHLQEAALEILQAGERKQLDAIFLTRALNAILQLSQGSLLAEATSAPSNYELLLRILGEPEALALLTENNPLAAARLRGLKAKQQLLEAEGGCISVQDVAEILGITRQAVNKRREKGQIIGISRGKQGFIYPIWQFDPDTGKTISGLEEILAELKDHDPWMQMAFMLEPNIRLDDQTPLSQLNFGNIESVKVAARVFGEHGAD